MAGPEKNLYKMVKEKLQDFNPIRIETTTVNGFPDLILFNKNKEVLFVECKVCERDKLLQNLRPHQKAFHHKYSKIFDGLYILQRGLSSREIFLYGSKNQNFLDGASTFDHCARAGDRENWDAIREKLNERHTISSSVAQMGK